MKTLPLIILQFNSSSEHRFALSCTDHLLFQVVWNTGYQTIALKSYFHLIYNLCTLADITNNKFYDVIQIDDVIFVMKKDKISQF